LGTVRAGMASPTSGISLSGTSASSTGCELGPTTVTSAVVMLRTGGRRVGAKGGKRLDDELPGVVVVAFRGAAAPAAFLGLPSDPLGLPNPRAAVAYDSSVVSDARSTASLSSPPGRAASLYAAPSGTLRR
jgi:hypothetical protein